MLEAGELKDRINELEKRKAQLIDEVRSLSGRLRYKEYEKKALQPFLDQTKDVKVGQLRKETNALEFKISTQAFTPKHEREWLKRLRVLEAELAKVREVERARHKSRLIEHDIEEAQKEISRVEQELKKVREELKRLYDDAHLVAFASQKGVKIGVREDELVSLKELGVIVEDKKKKN